MSALVDGDAGGPDVARAWRLLAQLDSLTSQRQDWFVRLQAQSLVGRALARFGLADSARSVLLRARCQLTSDIDPEQALLSLEAYVRTLLRTTARRSTS